MHRIRCSIVCILNHNLLSIIPAVVQLCEMNCVRFTCAIFVAYNYGKIDTCQF